MSFSDIFKKGFLSSYANSEITFRHSVLTMLVCMLIAVVISAVYYFKARRYFYSREFAVSLVGLSVITAAVILTIQSSVVVSLGMVGALSIVRFRTAIKNPLDLVFLFWAISVGIICGAGLFYIAVPLTLILGVVVLLFDEIPVFISNQILVLNGSYPLDEEKLEQILKENVRHYNVRTRSVHDDSLNMVIEIRGGVRNEQKLVADLRSWGVFHEISLLQQEGAVD